MSEQEHFSARTVAAPAPRAMPDMGRLPRSTPAATVGDDGDATLPEELDIAFSTHLTLVVQARFDFGADSAPQDVDLVIARHQLSSNRRLRMKTLLEAAQSALGRSAVAGRAGRSLRTPRALSARIAGQWQALCAWPAGDSGHALHAA